MDIGTIIKQYRAKHKMSLRDFAQKCGTSHSYISMLEARKNSKTGEPIVPTLAMLQKIASGLGMNLNELFTVCDDMPVSLSFGDAKKQTAPTEPELSEGEQMLIKLFRQIPPEQQPSAIEMLRSALKVAGILQ